MMMMADATSGIQFGQETNKKLPLIATPRQQTTVGFDVSKVPNGFTGKPIGGITPQEIPSAFGGGGGAVRPPVEDPLKLGAFFQANGVPRQVLGNTDAGYMFASNKGQVETDRKGGVASQNLDRVKHSGGASDQYVAGNNAAYTG
jgi:hypothetical protein